jgi:hypothetical protein
LVIGAAPHPWDSGKLKTRLKAEKQSSGIARVGSPGGFIVASLWPGEIGASGKKISDEMWLDFKLLP